MYSKLKLHSPRPLFCNHRIMYSPFLIVVLKFAHVITENAMEGRVVNGQLARIQRHPHSVYLFLTEKRRGGTICGASIVNQRVILSAAHCFERTTDSGRITANVGSSHIERGRTILVIAVRVHAQYNKRIIANDIAIAGLMEPIVFGFNAKRIVIPKQRRDEGIALLAGWGATEEYPHYVYSKHLREVLVPFISREKCIQIYSYMNNGTFCGGKMRSRSHPAVGDSGSPLVLKNYIQIGIVSYKIEDVSKSMIIYTDVPYFYDWISNNAKSVFCNK